MDWFYSRDEHNLSKSIKLIKDTETLWEIYAKMEGVMVKTSQDPFV